MKLIKKLVIAIVSVAFMLSSAGTVLADETAASSANTTTVDISKLSFDTVYGNQLPQYLGHEYTFNGEKIPVVESNYYFIMTFVQLCQYASYGYFPATSDGYIDLAATFGNNGETYADYFVEQSELYLQRISIYKARAIEAGLKLDDEDKKAVDTEISQRTEQQAKPAGVELEKILKLYFGPDCDEQAYRTILENAALASKYQQKYLADFKVPEDQKNIPNITYALFSAPASSASDDDKKKAEASAREMLGKCKSIDDLKSLGSAAKEAGTCRDAGTLPVQKGKMVPAFEKWAYGEGRKVGEMDVIYSEEYGYFCVGYNGLVELDESEKKDMASNALNTEVDEAVKAGKYTLKTGKAFPTPKPYSSTANQNSGESTTGKVLIIVFACIGGAALVVIVTVLIMNTIKGRKPAKKGTIKSGSKSSSTKKSSGSKKKKSGGKRR